MKTQNCGCVTALVSSTLEVVKDFSVAGDLTVWFLCSNVEPRLDLIEKLPATVTVGELGSKLDDAADRIEHQLLNIDEQILGSEDDRFAWGASLIGDSSPYATDLQRNAASYLVAQDILASGGRHLFIVESDNLAWAFSQTALRNGVMLECRVKPRTPSRIFAGLHSRLSMIRQYWRESRILKPIRRNCPLPLKKLRDCEVLIFGWAGEQTFQSNKQNSQFGHLTRMPQVLRNAGLKVGFIANPLGWTQDYTKIVKNVASAFDPVLLTCDTKSLGAVLRGAWTSWKMNRRLKKDVIIAGLNLSPILELERYKDLQSTRPTSAYGYREIGKFLVDHGIKPKVIVHPYERQGWERAFLTGMREYLPETRVVAYQHAPISARFISLFPSEADIESKRLPDQMITMGSYFFRLFESRKFPLERLSMGGSLRYETALSTAEKMTTKSTSQKNGIVLAGTSIDLDEALDLVGKAALALRALPEVRLVVNFHPVVSNDFKARVESFVKKIAGSVAKRVEFSNAGIQDLLPDASVLLYNGSGAAIDAILQGVPAVYVPLGGTISADKIPDHLTIHAANEAELQVVLQKLLLSEDVEKRDRSIGGILAEVDEDAIVKAVLGN
ncbi:MAG: hypothetical protein HON65_08140 [Rhodospirillales bacterium]|nr:hypothetical protein [Rhodospirillales bacterium]